MPKGVRLTAGEKAGVYSTKLLPSFKLLLGAQAMAQALALGEEASQRVLLEEMHRVYAEKYPERSAKALEIMGLLNPQAVENAVAYLGAAGMLQATEPLPPEQVTFTQTGRLVSDRPNVEIVAVPTVQYVGKPSIHLYDPGSKNSTGCGLSGQIDPLTITKQNPTAVDCKKCRYCRKSVFAI